ncbi:MAG TPA: TolC family protein, partial [Chitinophagaceae bacterium]|nr:TolC family protein [Chitinophagaceae bacterium]
GLESFKASNWFNIPNSLFGIAAGTIAQPIFQRRQLKTQFEVAKLQREEAVIRFRQSVLQAAGEVSDALVQLDKLKQQKDIAIAQTDTLQHAVVNAQLLFRADLANYLEVIIAQENLLLSELNLASLQRQYLSAMVELYRRRRMEIKGKNFCYCRFRNTTKHHCGICMKINSGKFNSKKRFK